MIKTRILPAGLVGRIRFIPQQKEGVLESIGDAYAREHPDIITNGPLISGTKPCWGVMSNGKWLTESRGGYGLHMDGGKYAVRWGEGVITGDFLAFYQTLLIGGIKQPIDTSRIDHTQARGRTAYGIRGDGALIKYVCDDSHSQTAAQMQDIMLALGCVDGGYLDGGGSSQEIGPDGTIKGSECKLAGFVGIDFNAAYTGTHHVQLTRSDIRISDHFKLSEFACKDGSAALMLDTRLPGILEDIRSACGSKAVSVNSGYRTAAYNAKVGGVSDSRHLTGSAADITISGADTLAVCKAAERALASRGIPGGIGRYAGQNFVHVDTRSAKSRFQQDKAGQSTYAVSGWAETASRPTLRRGSKGEDVRYMQKRLNAKGANPQLAEDADFGVKSDNAVKVFQQKNGLTADGVCGSKTWAKLEA